MIVPSVLLNQNVSTELRLCIEQFGLTVIQSQPLSGEYLLADNQCLSLCRVGEKSTVCVDFSGASTQYRRLKGGGELIAKAVNYKTQPIIWDATGGLGRDAFVLASLGLQVEVFEQHPAVACLLANGLYRGAQVIEIADIVSRIHLHFGNSVECFPQLVLQKGKPDVVYLDPMYPERQKSAAVKKEMAFFHHLVGHEQDEALLLTTACSTAKKRVVVKRPRLGAYLNGQKPAYQYLGKSTRFDVYLPYA